MSALFLNFSLPDTHGVYILGGICGGLLYMTAYNIFRLLPSDDGILFHAGSIGIVLAIVAASTAYRNLTTRYVFSLFGTVRLKYLALVVIVTDLLFITSSNAGGHIAHFRRSVGRSVVCSQP